MGYNSSVTMSQVDLIERQQRLLARSELLRGSLASQSRVIQRPLALADQVADGVQWLYRRPYWPTAAFAVLVILKPVRVLKWGGRMWWVWTSLQKVEKLLNR